MFVFCALSLLLLLVPRCFRRKPSRVHPLVKQMVQRLRCHIFGLGQPKERTDQHTQVQNSCWECSLSFEIPFPWVEYVWGYDDVDDGEEVTHAATERNGFVAELDGADFGCDGVGDRADGYARGCVR